MVYRMVTSIVAWVATTIMVLVGKLRGRELGYALASVTASTIVIWLAQPQTKHVPDV